MLNRVVREQFRSEAIEIAWAQRAEPIFAQCANFFDIEFEIEQGLFGAQGHRVHHAWLEENVHQSAVGAWGLSEADVTDGSDECLFGYGIREERRGNVPDRVFARIRLDQETSSGGDLESVGEAEVASFDG